MDRVVSSRVRPVPKGQQISIARSPSRPKVPVCALSSPTPTHMGMCPTRSLRSHNHPSSWQVVLTCHVFTSFLPARISFGNQLAAAADFRTHIELVTTQLVQAAPLTAVATLKLPMVLGAELRNSRSCHGRGGALDPD